MADSKEESLGTGIGKPLPSTGSYKPVGATPSAAPRGTGSHKPIVGNNPGNGSGQPLPPTGSYKPVGQTPTPALAAKRVADTASYLSSGQSSTKSSSTGQFKPIPASPAGNKAGSVFRPPAVKPPSGSRPRPNPTSLSAQLQVGAGGGKGPSSSTRVGSQWKCSSCNIALGPQSVVQGTAIILEGSLICVDCVKSGGKRRQAAFTLSSTTIWVTLGSLAAVLGGSAVFFPGQVLVMVLVIGILVSLVGLLGFTMGRTARLGTLAVGLSAVALSGWGMMYLREKAQVKAAMTSAASVADEISKDLSSDHIMEARRKIGAIEQKALVSGGGVISPAEQKSISFLKQQTDEWTRKNFGELTKPEHALLYRLFAEFGSVTTHSARKFRAIKISGDAVSLTIAADPADLKIRGVDTDDPQFEKKMKEGGPIGQRGPIMTSIPALDKAAIMALYLTRNIETISSLELKLVTAMPDGEIKEYRTVTLDSKAISDLKNGNPSGYREAFDAAVNPKQ